MGLLTPSKTSKPAPVQAEKAEKAEKADKRVAFVRSPLAKSILDDKGRLTALPGVLFDRKLHHGPKKNDFSTESLFLLHRADEAEQHAAQLAKRAIELRQEAEQVKNSPNPMIRSALKRLTRLKDMQSALEEQLKKEGIAF